MSWYLKELARKIVKWNRRRRVKSKDFSVLSNNCWAGLAVYQRLGMRYTTPTIGLVIQDDDYIKFLENLDHYLSCKLRFIDFNESKYKLKLRDKADCPVAKLDDIEIYFLHYSSEKEAMDKWYRRVSMLNRNKLLIKMSIRDNNADHAGIIRRFRNLPYKNKILFSPSEIGADGETVIYIPELKEIIEQGKDETPATLRHIDIIKLLNSL